MVRMCSQYRRVEIFCTLQIADFWQLGLEPIAVSAISGTGTGDLMEQLVGMLPPPKSAEEVDSSDKALAVAIIGRPNVGKSSILNSLVSSVRTARCKFVAIISRSREFPSRTTAPMCFAISEGSDASP